MSRGNPGATRWILTCPDCGKSWEAIGHGRWQKRGHLQDIKPGWRFSDPWSLEGPQYDALDSEPIARTVRRSVQCVHCRDRAISALAETVLKFDLTHLSATVQLGLLEREIDEIRATPIGPDGMKPCAYCGTRFAPSRRDARYHSSSCRKAVDRMKRRLESGLPLSSAMIAHRREARRRS